MAGLNNRFLDDFEFILWAIQGCEEDPRWTPQSGSKEFEEAVKTINEIKKSGVKLGEIQKNELMQRIRLSYLQSQKTRKRVSTVWAFGSSAFLCMALAFFVVKYTGIVGKSNTTVLVAPDDSVLVTTLKDGSRVWLSPGSQISYPKEFADDNRTVFLDGEGYFQITRNEAVPFRVKSMYMCTEVLGTSFAMKVSKDPTQTQQVVLIQGSVGVKMNKTEGTIILKPSELLSYSNESYLVREVNTDDYIAWTGVKQNSISGVNSIAEIAARLSQYYNVNIIGDENVMTIKCSGKLILFKDIYQTLDVLTDVAPIKYKIVGKGEIILTNI